MVSQPPLPRLRLPRERTLGVLVWLQGQDVRAGEGHQDGRLSEVGYIRLYQHTASYCHEITWNINNNLGISGALFFWINQLAV